MSLTGTHRVFASASETAINTSLKAIFTARSHYLNYGSSFFVPSSSVSATKMGSNPFPGIAGGVQWGVRFAIPVLDLYPPDSGSSPLPPPPGCFNVHTMATVTIGCMTLYGRDGEGYQTVPISTVLDVWAIGEVVPTYDGPGTF